MANKKISQLTAAGALTGAESVEVVQGGANVKTTTQDIANLGGGGGTWGSISGTLSNQTDLQSALNGKQAAGSYATGTGTANGTNTGDETAATLGATINAAAAATPNDADLVATVDTSVVKKITWTAVKAFLKTYFDSLYAAVGITLETVLTNNQSAANLNITNLADGASDQDAVNKRQLDAATAALGLAPQNEQTGANYDFVLGDAGKIVDRNNASANTATIPPNSSVAFALGTFLCINQTGAGASSFAPGSGVTITPTAGAGIYNGLGLRVPTYARKIGTNTWELYNGLPAATIRSNIYAFNYLPVSVKGSTRDRWYGSAVTVATTTTQGVGTNTLWGWPWIVSERVTVTDIQAEVSTGVGGANFRIGIYADNGTCYPGSLLHGTAALSGATNGVKSETLATPITLEPGLYWFALLSDTNITMRSWSQGTPLVLGIASTMGAGQPERGLSVALTYGALPSTFTASAAPTTSAQNAHMIVVRYQ